MSQFTNSDLSFRITEGGGRIIHDFSTAATSSRRCHIHAQHIIPIRNSVFLEQKVPDHLSLNEVLGTRLETIIGLPVYKRRNTTRDRVADYFLELYQPSTDQIKNVTDLRLTLSTLDKNFLAPLQIVEPLGGDTSPRVKNVVVTRYGGGEVSVPCTKKRQRRPKPKPKKTSKTRQRIPKPKKTSKIIRNL